MHNLHLLLIHADSAKAAAAEATRLIEDWGGENNWRRVGGVASEDGSDDIENHEHGRWGLSFLDTDQGRPEGTPFRRASAWLRLLIRCRAHDSGEAIPEFHGWQLDEFGLTDLTKKSAGARRYLVFLDM